MPTYDAVHIKYLLDGYAERARRREELNRILDERDMSGLECTETVQLEKLMARDFVDMPDMRDQLLAATQEIERLTRERDEARAEWQGADGKADWYAAECERLTRDLAASVSLINIHDECRSSAERECDRLRVQVREACSIAEWALSVVCGDIPMFRNGETLTKRAAIATIRHAVGVEGKGE